MRTEVISPPRGNLLDCNGALLATNRPVFDLYWDGTGRLELSQQQEDIVKKLNIILEIVDVEGFGNKIKFAEKYSKKKILASDISF
ncbi:hypothetical protein ACFLYH_03635, partial [Candidatus Dependentiae bacterium]